MHNAGFQVFQPVLVLEVKQQIFHHLSCDSHQLITQDIWLQALQKDAFGYRVLTHLVIDLVK